MPSRGRPPVLLTRSVDSEVHAEKIRQARASKDTRYLERLLAIQMLSEGRERADIATSIGRNSVTILQWLKLYNDDGYEGLQHEFKGYKKSRMTTDKVEELRDDIRKDPSVFGYGAGGWTAKLIFLHVKTKFGVEYHFKSWSRCLKSWKITAKVPRLLNAQQDPRKVETYWTETIPRIARKKKN
jgi:transposase